MKNKRYALVTGAGSGIGTVMAVELARNGYHVTFHYNNSKETAEAAVREVIENGSSADIIQANIREKSEIDRMFAEYKERFGRLDLFVNNSGVTRGDHFLKVTEETFDEVCDINWKGAYFCIQGAARIMAEQETAGNIVSIASNHAVTQFINGSVYGSMKAALVKLTRHAAIELAQYNIRVNTLAPGWVDHPRVSEKGRERVKKIIPMKRWCQPEDIAHMIMFLDGDYAKSITGNCIIMDGGVQLLSASLEDYGL